MANKYSNLQICVFMLFVLLQLGCVPSGRLIISNNSSNTLYWELGGNNPDTTLAQVSLSTSSLTSRKILPNATSSTRPGLPLLQFEDTLLVFFFDSLIANTATWDSIKANNLSVGFIRLSKANAVGHDLIIQYP
jgi:hypothetical protein